jgi:protein-disulfide isomerase
LKRIVISHLVVIFIMSAGLGCAKDPASASDPASAVVASFDGGSITDDELEAIAGNALVTLRQQMYEAKSRALENEVFNRLVAIEAAKTGISTDEFIKINVTAAVAEPTEDEIAAVMAQYRARLPKEDAEARVQVVNFLKQQAGQKVQGALRTRLFASANVKMLLDPPRVEISVLAFNPTRGPADAPVTIYEFTDFQCPYCSRGQEAMNQVMERYGDNVRHVFKHLPLPMHKDAHGAAQGSLCAADQGKFWEMHDWMFANRSALGAEPQIAYAKELGLDVTAFTTCLESKVHAPDVDQDMAVARGLGITGTPGFVINGRILGGAQPVEAFSKIIDDELQRKGLPIPAPPEVVETPKAKEKIPTQQVPPENAS